MSGGGTKRHYAWPQASSGSAFLVLDRNGDGTINNGSELFGNHTAQPPSAEENGFLALAVFDRPENGGNADGIIDARDTIFARLRLWLDLNNDGISQASELFPLQQFGIDSIELDYKLDQRRDRYGNWFRFRGKITGRDPKTGASFERTIYDVILQMAGTTAGSITLRDPRPWNDPTNDLRGFSRKAMRASLQQPSCSPSLVRNRSGLR